MNPEIIWTTRNVHSTIGDYRPARKNAKLKVGTALYTARNEKGDFCWSERRPMHEKEALRRGLLPVAQTWTQLASLLEAKVRESEK